MAADDDRGPVPDPWDEIVAEGLGEEPAQVPFQFDETVAAGAPGGVADEPSPPPAADGGPGPDGTEPMESALVDDWLSGSGADLDAEVPPLSVFPPDDAATGSSAIDIGTGTSGIALHGEPDQEEIGFESPAETASDDQADAVGWPTADSSIGTSDGEDGGADAITDFAIGAAGVATPAVPVKVARRPAAPRKKAGAIAQVVGVVLGGLLAIPIAAGIYIGLIWLGWTTDTAGLRKTALAFLLPPKTQPASDGPGTPADTDKDAGGGSALDDLPTMTEPGLPIPAVAVEGGADALPPEEPVPTDPVEPATTPAPPVPSDGFGDLADESPEPAPMPDVAIVEPPDLGAPGALGAMPAPAAAAEPPPLDTSALDQAVGDAEALGRALGLVEDRENRAYVKLRADWYRALAHVGEELVVLENAAATSGRPLDAAPDSVAALHGGINGQQALAAELAVAGPDWLAYEKRPGDGVVVPVTFASARKVGPYWTARVSLVDADGASRDLTIISRREPGAIAGERVIVTGVALDGGVIWAADIRGATGL